MQNEGNLYIHKYLLAKYEIAAEWYHLSNFQNTFNRYIYQNQNHNIWVEKAKGFNVFISHLHFEITKKSYCFNFVCSKTFNNPKVL